MVECNARDNTPLYNLIICKQACGFQRKPISIDSILLPRVTLSICISNLAYLGLIDRISCLALNQIEHDATNRRLVIQGTNHDKAEFPAKNEGQFLSSPKSIASRYAALIALQI
jgi:hypothetical protein